ncbi:hypothetical protein LPTSP4_04980 [Leptospira ryugenii]|uniref:Bacterial surface antigen (D15) domain-containing protein n=1 Tax=Leptospira ryugenii TaxID=1917863 RepID=A0A2P2DWH9_9LEPT|nr:hypothetical protein [Leptospira ryugenii]GBF48991.1 hypothetical protein LPTSP4_04980 [Leptospira ryugenii]
MKTRYFLLTCVCYGLATVSLSAQVWAPTGTETRRPSALQFDAGTSQFRGDYYVYLSPNFTYNHGSQFGYSFSLPLNFLSVDRAPKLSGQSTGELRQIDYNSRQDYLRTLNYISYGTYNQQVPGKFTYSLYAGKVIDGYVGHGTILNKYQSSSRFDAYNPSVLADANSDYGGVQYFSNSVASFNVNVVRVYVKPLAIGRKVMSFFQDQSGSVYFLNIRGKVIDDAGRKSVEEEISSEDTVAKQKKEKEIRPIQKDSRVEIAENDPWYNRLTLGYTSAWDRGAPVTLSYSSNGAPLLEKTSDQPTISTSKTVRVEGFDAEYRLLNLSFLEFTPYFDFNRIKTLDNSTGTHYGASLRIGNKDLNVILKPELRQMTGNYIPMYFDSFYEIERFQSFPAVAPMRTKFENLETQGNGTIKGYLHTIYLNFYHLGFEFAVEDYGGKEKKRVFAAAYIPIGSSFQVSFFFTKKGYGGQSNLFEVDENSQGAAEISKSFGPLMFRVQNYRRFVLDVAEKTFVSTDEVRFLVSGGMSF